MIAFLAFATSAGAVVLTLGAPDHAGVDTDSASALYGTTRSGGTALIVRVGGIAPDGSTFTDIGVPSESADGAVVFAAETRGMDDMQPQWNIYRAIPGSGRLDAILDGSERADGCRPVLKFDPSPVAGSGDMVGFIAQTASGGDALFRYSAGQLHCVARTGARTAQGDIVRGFGFGTVEMAADGEMVMVARVSPANSRQQKTAVALVAPGAPIREIALEGEPAPGGGTFGPNFGQPSIVASHWGPVVAFINRRGRSGSTVYQSSEGRLSRSFRTGAHTALGRLSYISDGHPGLNGNGTMVVRGACGHVSGVFLAKDGELSLVAREGGRTRFGTRLAAFADPYATADGIVLVSGHDDAGVTHLFSFLADGRSAAMGVRGPMPRILPGTVAADQRGDYSFLGAPPETDSVRTANNSRPR